MTLNEFRTLKDGDRVKVLWQEMWFTGTVAHMHPEATSCVVRTDNGRTFGAVKPKYLRPLVPAEAV